jgi:energy-coupling factor transporter ATP-binding protein EcfA2
LKQYNGHDISLMSGGELQRLKIASFLAYRYILNEVMQWSSNLLIFDEPDTFVDASGVKHMMEMIHKESVDKCVIVISHTNSMHRDMGLFENHLVIERDLKGSRKRKRN